MVPGFLTCSFWNLSKQSPWAQGLITQLRAPTERIWEGGFELESHASVFLGILSPAHDWRERGFDDIIAVAREGMQNKRDYGQDLENPKVERVELGNTFPQLYYFKFLFSL